MCIRDSMVFLLIVAACTSSSEDGHSHHGGKADGEIDRGELEATLSSPNALPRAMVELMLERHMGTQHDGWHAIRPFDEFDPDELFEGKPGWRAVWEQDIVNRDGWGLAFLAMHHHMLDALGAEFPGAAEFKGWSKDEVNQAIDTSEIDGVSLDADRRRALTILNNIDEHHQLFATTDELGDFVEQESWAGLGEFAVETFGTQGIHAIVHGEQADPDDPVDMMNFGRNIMNKKFWRLHGFLDRVWVEYLEASDQPLPVEAMEFQNSIMHMLTDPTKIPGP